MKLFSKYSTTAITLCVISLVLAGNLAAENLPSTVPFEYSFEGMANGESIVDTNGWYAETNSYATVTNTANPYGGTFPISTTHNTHIVLNTENGALTNLVNHNGVTDPVIWLDTMIQATRSEDAPANITNDTLIQIAMYVNTNGNLVIYHTATDDFAIYSNRLTELTNAATIGSNEWVRLTIEMDYAGDTSGFQIYRVRLNGTPMESDYGYANGGDIQAGGSPGAWHMMANFSFATPFSQVSSLSLSGTGFFDDFCIKNTDPFGGWIIATYINLPSWASVSPSSSFAVVNGANTSLVINVSNFWEVVDVMTNGTSIGSTTNIALNSVSGNYSVRVDVAAVTLTNNVPAWWLANYGTNPAPDNAYALADDDGDGRSNWEEWLASTDPTTSNEFEIIKHYLTNGNAGVVVWVSAAVDPQLPPFNVLRTTNLMAGGGGWEIAGSTNRPIGGGTNEWIDPSPPSEGVPAYYRVSATN